MSHYKPYPAYKDSGDAWLGNVPTGWAISPLKYRFRLLNEKTAERSNMVSLENIEGWTGRHIDTDSDFEGEGIAFQAGDILFGKLRPYLAKVLRAGRSGQAIGDFYVLRPEPGVSPKYAQYWLLNPKSIDRLNGTTLGAKMPRVSWDDMGVMPITWPSIDDQKAIVSHLDRETARIDALITKKTRFVELITEKITSLASQCLEIPEDRWIRLQHLIDVVQRPVEQEEGESYIKLGLLNRGRGIFKKEESDQEDMGDSDFFWVEAGDLILSGQFAWEGSIAMAQPEHEGCVVSHRFPVVRGRLNKVLTEYLFSFLASRHGDFILNDCSRGSAGRNKPLNMNALLKWKIPVPPIGYQQKIAYLVKLRERLKLTNERSIELLKERRSALITAAVTGQIDLREAA